MTFHDRTGSGGLQIEQSSTKRETLELDLTVMLSSEPRVPLASRRVGRGSESNKSSCC